MRYARHGDDKSIQHGQWRPGVVSSCVVSGKRIKVANRIPFARSNSPRLTTVSEESIASKDKLDEIPLRFTLRETKLTMTVQVQSWNLRDSNLVRMLVERYNVEGCLDHIQAAI